MYIYIYNIGDFISLISYLIIKKIKSKNIVKSVNDNSGNNCNKENDEYIFIQILKSNYLEKIKIKLLYFYLLSV